MPLVRIELLRGRSPSYRKALLDGVHAALVEAFEIPETDRNQRLVELAPEARELPPDKTEAFVLIEITCFQGRSLAAKKKLYQAIVRNLGQQPGIAGNDILIVLHEPPIPNWGLRGGRPASEVDLGFKIDV
ncbi:MAG TPA: tautomerase family protein [bacterium]|nr:tautomerase family protein [bacterium]